MGLQNCRSPNFENFGTLNLGVLGQNDIWALAPMAKHREYNKGEGGGFPPSLGHGEFCESVFARGSSMHQKWSNYALTNLFSLCRFV
jgi:hypothetical protein